MEQINKDLDKTSLQNEDYMEQINKDLDNTRNEDYMEQINMDKTSLQGMKITWSSLTKTWIKRAYNE